MKLKDELNAFYYSTALCDLYLTNRNVLDQSITHNSLLYLEVIYSLQGKCTASMLAEMLGVSKAAVTLKVNELTKQGLVTKVPDAQDHRRNFLVLNEDRVLQYKIYRTQDTRAVEKINAHFSAEDIEKFCQMLRILTDINFQECKRELNLHGEQ